MSGRGGDGGVSYKAGVERSSVIGDIRQQSPWALPTAKPAGVFTH